MIFFGSGVLDRTNRGIEGQTNCSNA